jgi:hypothetical protein
MQWKLFFVLLAFFNLTYAQETEKEKELRQELSEMNNIETGDLVIFDTIELHNAEVLHLQLKTDMEKKYYLWLRKRVRDVWPYVKVAVEEYNAIQDTAQYLSKSERKSYIKQRQKVLADEFENKLKDLSLSRGQILIKLIHRETDFTAFEIIKQLRGGMNAFLWNSAGGAFNLDLKTEFNPHKSREDLYIEVILKKDFASGRLERINEFK